MIVVVTLGEQSASGEEDEKIFSRSQVLSARAAAMRGAACGSVQIAVAELSEKENVQKVHLRDPRADRAAAGFRPRAAQQRHIRKTSARRVGKVCDEMERSPRSRAYVEFRSRSFVAPE